MTNQSTIDKLIEMRLTAMADAFRIQIDDPAMKEVPFEDRFNGITFFPQEPPYLLSITIYRKIKLYRLQRHL